MKVSGSDLGSDLGSAKDMLQKGSKSFAFATRFFSKECREGIYSLYAWCRFCDDITDGSHLGWDQQHSIGLPQDRVEVLKQKTHLGIELSAGTEFGSKVAAGGPIEKIFLEFGDLVIHYQIPTLYPEDLLQGMSQDALGHPLHTTEDLLVYCYRVAGTVGLMMCHLTGLKNTQALKNAVDLGIALQLTNIARDLADDYRVGKLYLPLQWFEEVGLSVQQMWAPESFLKLKSLMHKLLSQADEYYQSGLKGLVALPWRPALAVSIAASVYRAIGQTVETRLQKRGLAAWEERIVLNRSQKCLAFFRGIFIFLTTVPSRLFEWFLGHRTLSRLEIWRYS